VGLYSATDYDNFFSLQRRRTRQCQVDNSYRHQYGPLCSIGTEQLERKDKGHVSSMRRPLLQLRQHEKACESEPMARSATLNQMKTVTSRSTGRSSLRLADASYAIEEFRTVISALETHGLQSQVQHGFGASLLILVRAPRNLLGNEVYRSPVKDWLNGIVHVHTTGRQQRDGRLGGYDSRASPLCFPSSHLDL